MKLSSTFIVPAKRTMVFERFLDPEIMRSCIPGCEELNRIDEKHYTGRLINEIAHVRFAAAFSLEIVDITPPNEVRAILQGEDNRLASSLKLDATLVLADDGDDRTKVSYQMDLAMWGKLGRLGESIFRRRTADVEREFVERFAAACSSGSPDSERPLPAAHHAAANSHIGRDAQRAMGAQPRPVAEAERPAGERTHPADERSTAAQPEPSVPIVSPSASGPRPWWRRLADWVSGLVGRR